MRLETLLPLGKVDPGLRAPEIPLDLASIGRDARLLEEIGYHGMVVEETKDDPFVIMALAAQATSRLKIATSAAKRFTSSSFETSARWVVMRSPCGRRSVSHKRLVSAIAAAETSHMAMLQPSATS